MRSRFPVFCVCVLCAALSGYDWPLREPLILNTFGQRTGREVNTGIDLIADDSSLYPITDGEVVFRSSGIAFVHPLGNFVVLEHDEGFRSLYAHLESGVSENDIIPAKETFDRIGSSGKTMGKILHLEVYDGVYGQIFNPLLVLPKIADSQKPVIGGITLLPVQESNESIILNGPIPAGNYFIGITCYDFISGKAGIFKTIPYSFQFMMNGELKSQYLFDSCIRKGGYLVFPNLAELDTGSIYVFNDDFTINLGQCVFYSGIAKLELTVSDMAGNQTKKNFNVTVQ